MVRSDADPVRLHVQQTSLRRAHQRIIAEYNSFSRAERALLATLALVRLTALTWGLPASDG